MYLWLFTCSWDSFLPIGLPCPASIGGLSSSLVVSCFVCPVWLSSLEGLFVLFCFFLKRKWEGMDLGEKKGRYGGRRNRGRETVVGMYCIRESICNFKTGKFQTIISSKILPKKMLCWKKLFLYVCYEGLNQEACLYRQMLYFWTISAVQFIS